MLKPRESSSATRNSSAGNSSGPQGAPAGIAGGRWELTSKGKLIVELERRYGPPVDLLGDSCAILEE